MHQYNFPSYSVGETKPSRGPGRREIGHGALAERALIPVLPTVEEFPYAMRLVSEVLSSNGSTSQASICGSTLALMDAGVPIHAPVAGISCGLITLPNSDEFKTMVDIQGLEDFYGDFSKTLETAEEKMEGKRVKVPDEETDISVISHSLCLALDDVQDPGNLGTIVRLADWFGIEHIFCSPNTVDIYNPKTVQATMGGIARVRLHYTCLLYTSPSPRDCS